MIAGSEFGSNEGKQMLVVCALCGIKLLSAVFCAFLEETLHDAGCRPLYANPDVWMIPAIKSVGMEYWEYKLCDVGNMFVIRDDPIKTTCHTKLQFKLKDGKAKEPERYILGQPFKDRE